MPSRARLLASNGRIGKHTGVETGSPRPVDQTPGSIDEGQHGGELRASQVA
jgi:hypothetical protein